MTAAVGFVIGFRQIRLGLRQLCLRIKISNVIRGLVDDKKDIAFFTYWLSFTLSSLMLPETCGVMLTCSARTLPSRVQGDCI
jgi:hypothetical protein